MATPKRPTPLEHYLLANNEMFKIVDSKRTFLNIGYKSAAASLKEKQAKSKKPVNNSTHAKLLAVRHTPWHCDALHPTTDTCRAHTRWHECRSGHNGPRLWSCFASVRCCPWSCSASGSLASAIHILLLLPLLLTRCSSRGSRCSKMKCEELAYSLSTTDLTSNTEKSEIHVFIENSLSQLKGGDRQLPQVLRIKDLLKRGLGVHHGGLLPIIKEVGINLSFSSYGID